MTESTMTVSVAINAPAEQVWPLLIEQQQSNEQKMMERQYLQREPEGPPVTGQVIHLKMGCLRMTASIDRVVQAEPPLIGQTIYARVSFLGEGSGVSSWARDSEHYHLQTQSEVKHPWLEFRNRTSTRCLALDPTSCVVVYVEQSEMTSRLLPRWLTHRLNHGGAKDMATTRAIEASLQSIKAKAEQARNHHIL